MRASSSGLDDTGPGMRIRRRGFVQDDSGAELVQFALVIPIIIGLIWFSIEAWQLAGLRAELRNVAMQAGRYVTAYAAPPDAIRGKPGVLRQRDVCAGVAQLVDTAMASSSSRFAGDMSVQLGLHRIISNLDVRDTGNIEFKSPPWAPTDGQKYSLTSLNDWYESCSLIPDDPDHPDAFHCNDQFVLVLQAQVPWRSIIFGLGGVTEETENLRMTETVVGTMPCMPFMNIEARARSISKPSGGCSVEVSWHINGTFMPERIEVWSGERLLCLTHTPEVGHCWVEVPSGGKMLTVKAISGIREDEVEVFASCP